MSKSRFINSVATYDAIMNRSKEEIADQLVKILSLLYTFNEKPITTYGYGWNDSRKTIQVLCDTDLWVKRGNKK
jgi:hypothetical protein